MTITLEWWHLPLIITLLSFLYSVYEYHTDNSYLPGLMGFIVMIIGVGISLGIVLGHFL